MTRALTAWLLLLAGCFGAHDAPSHRVTPRTYAPEGGGEPIQLGWHDHELDVDCGFFQDEHGDRFCMPSEFIASGPWLVYADAACTDAYAPVEGECAPSRFVLMLRYGEDWSGCGPRPADRPFAHYEPYEVGEPATLDRGYRLERDGTCTPLEASEHEVRALRRIDPAELVRGAYVEPSGPGLSLEAFMTEEGVVSHHGFVDRALGRCDDPPPWRPHRAPPARVPCVFGGRSVVVLPGGGVCGDPYGLHRQPECGPPDAHLAVDAEVDECSLPTGYRLHQVGEVLDAEELPEGCSVPDGTAYVSLEPAPDDAGVWRERVMLGDGRLQRYGLSHDELVLGLALYQDTELGIPCTPSRTADGLVCAPGIEMRLFFDGPPDLFADAGCTAPATAIQCEPYLQRHIGCGRPTLAAVYRTAEPVERAYRRDDSGACVEAELAEGVQARALEEIPLSSLARFRPVAGD